MKQNSVIKERAYRRADKTQQDALDSVLGLLVCKPETVAGTESQTEPATSVVPYERKDAFVLMRKRPPHLPNTKL